MKDQRKISYTMAEQIAGDANSLFAFFIKMPKWQMACYIATAFYIVLVCLSMYKLGDSTTQLYEYPYTVSREAKRRK